MQAVLYQGRERLDQRIIGYCHALLPLRFCFWPVAQHHFRWYALSYAAKLLRSQRIPINTNRGRRIQTEERRNLVVTALDLFEKARIATRRFLAQACFPAR